MYNVQCARLAAIGCVTSYLTSLSLYYLLLLTYYLMSLSLYYLLLLTYYLNNKIPTGGCLVGILLLCMSRGD